MTVQEGPGGVKTRIINKNYPVTEGLVAGTTRQPTTSPYLEAEEESLISDRRKVGLNGY